MSAGLQGLIESKSKQIVEQHRSLVKGWDKYISAVDTLMFEREKKHLSESQKAVIARCLENALVDSSMKSGKRLMETTYQNDISFLGIQLPVIAALLPSLALNELAVVQALDRRQGSVFYLDVKYGTTKGSVTAATDMIAAKTGHNRTAAGRRYATNRISGEVIGTGDGSDTTPTVSALARKPVVAGSVRITATVASTNVLIVDNGANVLTGTGVSGTVDYNTGVVALTFVGTAPDNGTAITAAYRFDMGKDTAGVGEVDFKLIGETVSAEDFKLRSNYEMGAAIDLEKAHGIVLDDEIVKILGGEIKFEIDHMGIDLIAKAARGLDINGDVDASLDPADAVATWDASVSGTQEWIWKINEFKKYIEKGNNNILQKTLRAYATYILCGANVAAVIRQLSNNGFKPANVGSKPPAGPHVIGELDGRVVVFDPLLDQDEYTLGFKGDSVLYGSFMFSPYIPLFSTPTLTTADLKSQRGFMSSAGFKVLNAGMLCEGQITGY